MGKYDPLERHLRRQTCAALELTFAEIERLVGSFLPGSASRPQWWANESGPHRTHVQCEVWLRAGFSASLLVGKERVRFVRSVHVPADP